MGFYHLKPLRSPFEARHFEAKLLRSPEARLFDYLIKVFVFFAKIFKVENIIICACAVFFFNRFGYENQHKSLALADFSFINYL